MHHVMAENVNMYDSPFFQNRILTIPRIDTPVQSGNFHMANDALESFVKAAAPKSDAL